ncbi:MAG TPA: DMT family transporter [Acidimicrobiales bacterium]|nr:DMT family transporter [Acidimicrobiales bacterium]
MARRSWLWSYLALGVTWGCSFLFIKEALGFLAPFGVAFVRCALGAATLFALSLARREPWVRQPAVWGHLWVVSLTLNVVPGILFAVAETRVTSVVAGIVNALTPLTTLFFIVVVFRDEPVHVHQVAGLGLGLVGVLVVLGVWRGLGPNPWWAVLALGAAVVLYGVSFPYTRRHLLHRGLSPVSMATAQLILATATLAPLFALRGLNGHAASPRALASVVALGALGSGLAYVWNFSVQRAAGSAVASTVTYLTPVVAVVAGVVVLGEPLAWYEPVGGALVLLGAALGQGRFRRYALRS